MGTPNLELLREVHSENETARKIIHLFAKRKRGRQDTNFRRLKRVLDESGHKVTKEDLIGIFQKFQAAGLGRLVMGRNIGATRFIWDFNLKSVAKVVTGKAKALTPAPEARVVLPVLTPTAAAQEVKEEAKADGMKAEMDLASRVVHIKGNGFEMAVPMDLTAEESKGLKHLLHSLTA